MRKIGRPRVHLRETDSTNERAKSLALAGAPHGTLVTAGRQTAGRGRLGRRWEAPAGSSVLASVLVRGLAGQRGELLPLAVAIAVCEACERSAPVRCAVKWPNDVWVDGRKVAGILLAGRPQEGWAVVGIGINVSIRPEELPQELRETATSLAAATGESARPPEVEAVIAALTRSLEAHLEADPGEVLAGWRARDALGGRKVQWDGGEGIARGIDAGGALLVDSRGGRVELHAGEVGLVRPAPRG